MAENLGSAELELRTDSRRFNRGLDQAQQRTSRFGRVLDRVEGTARRVTDGIFSLRGALVGLGAIGVGRAISGTLNNFEQINRQAESLGASRQTIQELSFTFRQFGLENRDVSDALATLSDRADDAISGMQSFQDDFEAAGIAVDELRGKAPGELFELFAERLSGIEDPARRTALAVRILGDEVGQRLLPLITQGGEGLERFAREAREAGAVVSDELVRDSAEAARDFRALKEVLTAQFAQTVANNAQQLSTLATALTDVAIAAAKVGSGIVNVTRFVGEELAAFVNGIAADDLVRLNERLNDINQQLANPRALTSSQAQRLREERAILEERIELAKELNRGGGAAAAAAEPVETEQAPSPVVVDQAEATETERTAPTDLFGIMDVVESARDARDEIARQLQAEGERITEAVRTPLEQFEDRAETLSTLFEAGAIDVETFNRAMEQARNRLEDAGEQAQQTGDELSEFAVQAARNTQDAFADFLFDPFDEGLSGMLDSFVTTLRRMAAESAAENVLGSLFGGSGGGGLISESGIGGLFSDLLPGFADGGRPRVGVPSIVGERGPEVFVPDQSGSVLPNEQSMGRNVTVVQNIQTPDVQSFRRSRAAIARDARDGIQGGQ